MMGWYHVTVDRLGTLTVACVLMAISALVQLRMAALKERAAPQLRTATGDPVQTPHSQVTQRSSLPPCQYLLLREASLGM